MIENRVVRVLVLGTGSSGNALLIESGESSGTTRVLVDGGVGPRKTEARLARLGLRFSERAGDRIDAVVATHEHGDHCGQVESLARAFGAAVWMHRRIDGFHA